MVAAVSFKSERTASTCRANKPSRALSTRSFRFSRTKNDCSGESKTACGSLMRLTRTRSFNSVCRDCNTRSPHCTTASVGVRANFGLSSTVGGGALASGISSISSASSSIFTSKAGVSARAMLLMRARSLATARWTRAKRGCAARERRKSTACKVSTTGSMLPLNWACCCAKASADSMSTSRFSSRARDRLCISSSNWLRCRATSASR